MFVVNEFLQLLDAGPRDYFSSFFNIADFSTFPLVCVYVATRQGYSEIMPYRYVSERVNEMTVGTLVSIIVLNCFLILQANVKVIFFTT